MEFIPDRFNYKISSFKLPVDLLKDFEHLSSESLGKLFKNIFKYFNLQNINVDGLESEFEVLILRIFEANKFGESNYCYLIKMFNEHEEFIKIGFSNNIESRYQNFNNAGYVVKKFINHITIQRI